ncbi:hypothetical protein COCNU_16G004570 [Cocos nucifera]|uniref:RNA helicase n=1 Tax=Cocos nucifera TaxID=13894 RepID=A0A8K0IYB1_COCNU|nr:hypothetical protein COCNU_16G004570 [Cocos nucifera]
MSKKKFGFEGFGINRPATYSFERSQAPQRLYVPPSSRGGGGHDNYEDHDLDNIDHDQPDAPDGPPDAGDSDGEIDPLDAFMEGIHEEIRAPPPPSAKPQDKGDKYPDDDEDDPVESFLRDKKDVGLTLAADALRAGYDSDEEVYAVAKAVDAGMIEYDSDDNPIGVDKKKIEPIPALDHSTIEYEPFNKDFYEEKPSISGMSEQDVADYRKSLAIRTSGFDVPKPIKAFEDCGFSTALMNAIAKQGKTAAFVLPMIVHIMDQPELQKEEGPIGMSEQDVADYRKSLAIRTSGFDVPKPIKAFEDCGFSTALMNAIAKQGKTAAFVLPMIVHIMDQPELQKEEGPIGVICTPTRELAHQIYLEAKKFAKPYGIRVAAVYGGVSKLDQFKDLKAGCEIVVANQGRLIDLLKMKALTMFRATYLVLDEADRMFDLGFEPQIRSVVGQLRPDRQTLLFSATMPYKVERLAREILTDPVRVTVGDVGMANEDITQVVSVIPSDADKMPWLLGKLPEMIDEGDVLVFASKKATVDEIESRFCLCGYDLCIWFTDFLLGMSEQDVADYQKSLAICPSGFDVPKPIKTFEDCGFSTALMNAIANQGYGKPTPIQCQALPIVLSGRDIIGIAKTGSGKTAAFVLLMIVHIMDQPELQKEEGPIGVICAPTRELAHQIYLEEKKFAKPYGIWFAAVYGGMSKLDQFKELKAGCEMIRSIVGQLWPDRQTLLFSATMPYKVERLAREILTDPVRVTVGEVGMANEDVTQVVSVIPSDDKKMPWLLGKLPEMIDEGDVCVFASKKATVDEIESHSERIQMATDVAACGLNIKSTKVFVNFDVARDMDMHVHLIGSTESFFVLHVRQGGRFRAKCDPRKGWKKVGGRGKGGGVRSKSQYIDYGLGIGYNPKSANATSQYVPSRSSTVDSLRTGMMAQFKSNFVAGSSNSLGDGRNQSSLSSTGRPVPRGFVSGVLIGGEACKSQSATSFTSAFKSGGNTTKNGNQKNSERRVLSGKWAKKTTGILTSVRAGVVF